MDPDRLFILFGMYGDVYRVKLLHRKKNTALIQWATPEHAALAMHFLNRMELMGATIMLNVSKYREINLPNTARVHPHRHSLRSVPLALHDGDRELSEASSHSGGRVAGGDKVGPYSMVHSTSSVGGTSEGTRDFFDSTAHRFRSADPYAAGVPIAAPSNTLLLSNLAHALDAASVLAFMQAMGTRANALTPTGVFDITFLSASSAVQSDSSAAYTVNVACTSRDAAVCMRMCVCVYTHGLFYSLCARVCVCVTPVCIPVGSVSFFVSPAAAASGPHMGATQAAMVRCASTDDALRVVLNCHHVYLHGLPLRLSFLPSHVSFSSLPAQSVTCLSSSSAV